MPEQSVYRVSCRVSAAILKYAEAQGIDASAMCEKVAVSYERMVDTRAWIGATAVLHLWRELEKTTGNVQVAEKVGHFAVEQGTLGALATILRLSGSPKKVMQKTDRLVGYFDNFHSFKPIHIGTNSALLEVRVTGEAHQTHHDCAFIRGVLSAIPTLWGLTAATVEGMSCAVPLIGLPAIGGRRYEPNEEGVVFSSSLTDADDRREEGRLEEDGTFTLDGIAYNATACLYRVTWEKEATKSVWQRVFPNSAALAETVNDLERDVREMEEMYEKLHRFSSRLEQMVEERTAELGDANRELAELAEKLQRQSRLKSEFIADISHELRTLITAIMGFSDLLFTEIYGPLNDRQKSACERIALNTRTLLAMINDMLDLSRLQVGKMEAVYEPVYMRELVESAVGTVAALAEQKDLKLTGQIEQEVPVRIHSDKTKIKQMLLNLLSNAIKFTDRGRVAVRVHMPAPDVIAVTVEDTGRGIASEDLPQLFEEYSRVRRGGDEENGTGLGLFITRKMAELLGGRVDAVSKVDHGSAFTVYLPIRAAADSDLEEINENPAYLDPERNKLAVLIADAEEESQKFLGLSLEAEGLQVENCDDGRRLLWQIKRNRPDLLVLDPLLDHEDGWSVLQNVRSDPEIADLPVIVTGRAPESQLCESLGVVRSFAKPYDRNEVVQAVLELLGLSKEGQ